MAKSKIIKDLANSLVDTITALKRAKVLVSDLNNDKISKWLNYEISGYPEDAIIPSYRKVQGNLIGSYVKSSMEGNMILKNVSLPLGKMADEFKEVLLRMEFQEGVESLKKLAEKSQAAGIQISKPITADLFSVIEACNNDQYMMITSARVVVSEHIISNIFSILENKLLDMLMILEKEFGCLDELDIDTTAKSEKEIEAINNRILVLVFNDNSITIGDGNKIKDTTIASDIN